MVAGSELGLIAMVGKESVLVVERCCSVVSCAVVEDVRKVDCVIVVADVSIVNCVYALVYVTLEMMLVVVGGISVLVVKPPAAVPLVDCPANSFKGHVEDAPCVK